MLFNLLLGLHVIVCLALIVVVLLQSSKGGGLAGAFGGGGGQTMFGGQETATFLSRTTTYLAVAFMVLSLFLALLSGRRSTAAPRSVVREAAERQGNVIPSGQSIDQILGSSVLDTMRAPAGDTTGTTGE
jgi:preprotein translocase subunit SecG